MDHYYRWHATRCSRDPIFAKKSDKRFLVKKINKVKEDLSDYEFHANEARKKLKDLEDKDKETTPLKTGWFY